MRRSRWIYVGVIGLTLLGFTQSSSVTKLEYPKSWPKPHYNFKKNPLTEEKIYLGRKLFYDPILSKDNSISCSSCHLNFTSFTHVDHALSHGIGDSVGNRNSPVLVNLAWQKLFMWDGAVNHLDVQALAPISHPKEMGEDISNVVEKLKGSRSYLGLFEKAYGDPEITGERVLKAISQFQLTLVSDNSKYDKVKRGEAKFNRIEEKGYQVFLQKCNSCHTEPLMTNGEFANNGLPIDPYLKDYGRTGISGKAKDSLKFKVPTLRNIEFSLPYMHDGRFKTLLECLDHYSKGITESKTLASELKDFQELTHDEKVQLISFLLTLSDKEFIYNKKFAFPR